MAGGFDAVYHFYLDDRGISDTDMEKAFLEQVPWKEALPLLLEEAGYHIGFSYKVWSPGRPADAPYGGKRCRHHEAGAKFYCCSPNLDLFDMTKEDLIPECEGIVGGAHLIEEVMEGDCRVLSY